VLFILKKRMYFILYLSICMLTVFMSTGECCRKG
jgi:hypothetical protein